MKHKHHHHSSHSEIVCCRGPRGFQGDTGANGKDGNDGLTKNSFQCHFNYIQPNGKGFESTTINWTRCNTFVYKGSLNESQISEFYCLLYSTNVDSFVQLRLYDLTHDKEIGVSSPSNLGTLAIPEIQHVTTITNIPETQAVFEIQIKNSNNNHPVGVCSVQIYGQ